MEWESSGGQEEWVVIEVGDSSTKIQLSILVSLNLSVFNTNFSRDIIVKATVWLENTAEILHFFYIPMLSVLKSLTLKDFTSKVKPSVDSQTLFDSF